MLGGDDFLIQFSNWKRGKWKCSKDNAENANNECVGRQHTLTITSMTMNWEKRSIYVPRIRSSADKTDAEHANSGFPINSTSFFCSELNREFTYQKIERFSISPNRFLMCFAFCICLFFFSLFSFARPNVCAKQERKKLKIEYVAGVCMCDWTKWNFCSV